MSSHPAVHVSLARQLFSNQIWETVAFAAKAFFVIGLTPWMLRVWGAQGYGEFAFASSLFVLLAILDLGVRNRTRVALCRARSAGAAQWPIIMGQGLAACGIISLAAVALAALLTLTGSVRHLMGLSSTDPSLLFITTALAMPILFSGLLLEPLVASGLIGRLKLATASGWIAAIGAVAGVLSCKGSVTTAVVAWLGCLLLANVLAALVSDLETGKFLRRACTTRAHEVSALLREGFWFSIANATWLTKTYGATLLIFALEGAATAGVFYILLRLSEVISSLGAIAADVSLGDLASATVPLERQTSFRSSYSWALLFSLYSALLIGFFISDFDRAWLHSPVPIPPLAGLVIVVLGLASALNRTATYAAMALGAIRAAARWGALEAVIFLSIIAALPRSVGLLGQLATASLSACALVPLAKLVSQRLDLSLSAAWIRPILGVLPGVVTGGLAIGLAAASGHMNLKILAGLSCGGLALAQIVVSHGRANRHVAGYLRARQAKFRQNTELESA